jgi:hypothetical protein
VAREEYRRVLSGLLEGGQSANRSNEAAQVEQGFGRACIVDLNDVTFIDKGAEKLLRTMAREGAQLIAHGGYIKNVFGKQKIIDRRGLSGKLAASLRFARRSTRTMSSKPAPL